MRDTKVHGRTNKLDKYLLELNERTIDYSNLSLCATADDPDLWFSEEIDDLGRMGSPTPEQIENKYKRTITAIKICNNCPAKEMCLTEGMRESNIDSGVWGGLMSGERLTLAGKSTIGHWRRNKVQFAKRVRDRIQQGQ